MSNIEFIGIKSLPPELRKPPQKTVKVNDQILPFVLDLKESLRTHKLTSTTLERLFNVLQGKQDQQTDLYKNPKIFKIVEDLRKKNIELESKLTLAGKEILDFKRLVEKQNQLIYELNQQPLKDEINRLIIKSNKEVIKAASLEGELKQLKETNIKLVLKYDTEHLKSIKLESRYNSIRSDITQLKSELSALKHKEYACMALKKTGDRCTKQGKVKIEYNGIEIKVCIQHSKSIIE